MRRLLFVAALLIPVGIAAQNPPAGQGGQKGGAQAPQARLTVTTTAFPDGGEIPMRNAGRGENKSPAFEFKWYTAASPSVPPPAELKTYAVIFHDIENSTMRTTADTLHWSAFNIPGTATGIAEGLGPGDLPDGTINGPGIGRRGGSPGSYFGPGAGPGPFHHYIFEFYALDIKLELTGAATREELLKAMDGHVIGKAAYFGRFRAPSTP
jgi:Raf kinase inhibitor-like YbhB/YbcL family protein